MVDKADRLTMRSFDVQAEMAEPPVYSCRHIGKPTTVCKHANDHPNAPYTMSGVTSATPCPDCKHRNTLYRVSNRW